MTIGIILGIVFALAIIGGCAWALFSFSKASIPGIIVAVVALLCFTFIPFSFHTVKTGEIAVVKHMGVAKEVRTAGTYFDFWVTESYTKYDTKVQNLDIVTAAYSADAQTMDIQMTLQYQIKGENVLDIFTHYGSIESLQNRIQSISVEKVKSVLSSHKAMDIIEDRASMSPIVEETIRKAVGEEYFVDVVAVVVTNIDFSDAFELAVEEKMIAEQAKLKADYENQKQIAKVEAEAEANLKKAQAEIDIAKAKAEAAKIAAEGEAAANKIVSESLTKDIINKIYAEKWDGKMPTVVGSGDYILPSDIMQ